MLKKPFNVIISMVLTLAILFVTCTGTLAASAKKVYIKEVIISYGKTADEAKKWLTDNGYTVLDCDLNEGADDLLSTKRAVYLGYKTTKNAEEAITDMKLMNMKGGYSVHDYQMLLSEQQENIKVFLSDFHEAVAEYRKNYGAGQARAVSAHDMLNMMLDDDTGMNLGDLLLRKTKEEYTSEEWDALSDEEKAKTADMTTILMQGNSNAVLAMEQIIAMATDDGETPWICRYENAKTYDEMLDALMESENLTVNAAEKRLAAEYDEDAKKIAANLGNYKTYLEAYTNSDVRLTSSAEELEAFLKECEKEEGFVFSEWTAAGTQYELLSKSENDGISLLDVLTSDEYDVSGDDRYLLYPLISVLSKGQRACLDFLPTNQLVSLGINDDATVKAAMENVKINSADELKNVSIYAGVDRTIFGGNVAITNDALRLQTSSGKSAISDGSEAISNISLILYGALITSAAATGLFWNVGSYMTKLNPDIVAAANVYDSKSVELWGDAKLYEQWGETVKAEQSNADSLVFKKSADKLYSEAGYAKYFRIAGYAMLAVSVVLMGISIWSTVNDIIEYYNAEFIPIPVYMVDQSVNENDEKVYTYYSAVRCNRAEQGMVTDETKLLGDLGDLNGDVGRQWLALYTTKDKAAGNPITTDIVVQYKSSNLPKDKGYALSMFGESVAQNLTNKRFGYTYADGKGGIYLFYNVDNTAFAAGSIFSNAKYILIGVAEIAALAAVFFIGRTVGKKKRNEEA